jgi:hypothetical protein
VLAISNIDGGVIFVESAEIGCGENYLGWAGRKRVDDFRAIFRIKTIRGVVSPGVGGHKRERGGKSSR